MKVIHMRKEMIVFMALGLVVFSATPASAFSLGEFWGSVKERIGLGGPQTVQVQTPVQEQAYVPQPQPPVDASGRVDTSVMNQNQNQHQNQVASRFEVMNHDQGSGLQVQVQHQTQVREHVHLANKAGLVAKVALWGKDKECERWGGIWYWEADKVGCQGIDGRYSCDNYMVQKAAGMCTDQGASFVCNESGIYCAYT